MYRFQIPAQVGKQFFENCLRDGFMLTSEEQGRIVFWKGPHLSPNFPGIIVDILLTVFTSGPAWTVQIDAEEVKSTTIH